MASSPVLLQGAGGALSGFTGLEGPARKIGGVVAGAMAQRDAQQFESDGGRGGGVDGWMGTATSCCCSSVNFGPVSRRVSERSQTREHIPALG